MSILAALSRAYDRMALRHEVPAFGYSSEKIGYVISLLKDGAPASPPIDLRVAVGKKLVPALMQVPQPAKRTSGIAPNFLWDKTSYVLGVTLGDGKRLDDEHAAFVRRHDEVLGGAQDAGLRALLLFLQHWKPDQFAAWGWPEEMKDQNVIFALECDRTSGVYIHDRPDARALWARLSAEGEKTEAICLVSGERAPVARLHPAIKGVWGAQSSGASIVSFNLDAFTSYGHEQGDNAPVSEAAAFAYTAALNRFLESGSRNRLQIGDASTVFWAEAGDAKVAETAEDLFLAMFAEFDEQMEANKVGAILERIRNGQALSDFEPGLAEGVKFNVLGLAPNAARLSIRFWLESSFGHIAENYRRFSEDMRIEPGPRDPNPPLWRYLNETAVLRKRENVPPNLAGDWIRAILSGTPYPRTLLSAVLVRIRADKEINVLRAAMLRAVLVDNRDIDKEGFVALDPENNDPAYLLGRLFAVLEKFQTLALGRINASIRDRYYGSASATPRNVFPMLIRLNLHHRAKAEQGHAGLAGYFAKQLAEVMNGLPSEFPATLSLQAQGKFALGYYHQFNSRKANEAGYPVTENAQQ